MPERPKSAKDARASLLRQLYAEDEAVRVARAIDTLVEQNRGDDDQRAGTHLLGESDVLLITYGDTLVEPGLAPLAVLRNFHGNYLKDVFDLVHVLPFHPYSSDDGFSVIDYDAVREDLGNWDDVEDLAQSCRLMADAVVNHTSKESPWFAAFLAGDAGYEGFYVEADPGQDLSAVTRPRTSPLLTRFEDAGGNARHIWTTFSDDQVDLNYANPDVLAAVIEVLLHLVAKGAQLLRLDAVTFLWKEAGTSCANLPQTHALIKIMRSAISEARPDVIVITETNVPHRENVAYFGDGTDEAHMVYNFALPPLLAHSFITGNSRHISDWAGGLSLPGEESCFLNFSASHDGVGVRPVEEILTGRELQGLVDAALAANGLVSSRTLSDGREQPYEINCTFLDLISVAGEEEAQTIARFVASQSIVLAMPGVPAIYIQSLLGTRNDVDNVRSTGRARSINRTQHKYSVITSKLADPDNFEARVFATLLRLVALRRTQSAFDPYASFDMLDIDDRLFAIRRENHDSGESVACLVNLGDETLALEIDASIAGKDLLSGDEIPPGNCRMLPYGILWIRAAQGTLN